MTGQDATGQGKVGDGDGRNGIRVHVAVDWNVWKGGPRGGKAAMYEDQEPGV